MSDRQCQQCGVHFTIPTRRLKYGCGRYCSAACKRVASKKQVKFTCPTCGRVFELPQCRKDGARRFCSRKCLGLSATRLPIADRFWKYVLSSDRDDPSRCWNWQGARYSFGYGELASKRGKPPYRAHVISWEIHKGRPANGYILHTCDNPACVNPAHLREGTQADNINDMRQKKRHSFGSRHPCSKLSEDAVRLIRQLRKSGETYQSLANRFHVATATIRDAVSKRTWKLVD